jgi:hypothetical protein
VSAIAGRFACDPSLTLALPSYPAALDRMPAHIGSRTS